MSAEPDRTHQKPPFLKRVRIRNYKSIKFCDVELEPLTVLVGRNGSGKSNFVDALGFLRDVVTWDLRKAVTDHGGRQLFCRSGDDRLITFDLEFCLPRPDDVLEKHEYHLVIELPTEAIQPTHFVEERATVRNVYGEVIDQYTATFSGIDTHIEWGEFHQSGRPYSIHSLRSRPALAGVTDSAFGRLYQALELLGTFNFDPRMLRASRFPEPDELLSSDGKNAVDVVMTLGESDPWLLSRLSGYLRAITGNVEFSSVVTNPHNVEKSLFFRVRHLDPDKPATGLDAVEAAGELFPATSMSDGTLRAFAALLAVFQQTSQGPPSLVAIEEPETSLHPAATAALVDALDEATGRTQVLITTHSAELLDNPTIRPENVRVVEMIDGETIITGVDEATEEIYRERFESLGGLERQNQLKTNYSDRERQKRLAAEAAPQ